MADKETSEADKTPTKKQIVFATKFIKEYNINANVVPIYWMAYGIMIEFEHGKINKLTNVSDDDYLITAKIALAHIIEYPDYYKRLRKMEMDAEKAWKGYNKNIFQLS
jgi:hypothetical protein